jgi:hypothetical protein
MTSSKSAKRRRRHERQKRHLKASAATSKPIGNPIVLQAVASFNEDSLQGKKTADGKPKLPTFTMRAYSGGMMTPNHYDLPVVVNLSGLTQDGRVPIFLDHNVSGSGLVGHATVNVTGAIDLEGVVSGNTESATTVVESAKKGFPWQCSIGCEVQKRTLVEDDESLTVNGQKFKGPFYHIEKSYLYETSFVPIGADRTTSAAIAAKRKGTHMSEETKDTASVDNTEQTQDLTASVSKDGQAPRQFDRTFSKWIKSSGFNPELVAEEWSDSQVKTLQAAYDAEQDAKNMVEEKPTYTEIAAQMRIDTQKEIDRQEKVREICRNWPSIMSQAIGENWSLEKTELAKLRAELDRGPTNNVGARSYRPPEQEVIEAAMCLNAKLDPEWLDASNPHWSDSRSAGIKGYSEQTLDAASDLGHYEFSRLFLEYLASAGVSVAPGTRMSELYPKIRDTHLRMVASGGFSTVSISGILSNVMGKRMLEMFESVSPVAQAVSAARSVPDFKETKSFRISGNGDFLLITPTSEIQGFSLREEEYANRPATYGRKLTISREMLMNDDLGALTAVPRILGRKAAIKLQRMFFELWTGSTASTFFATGNSNLQTSSALTIATLGSGETLFLNQQDADGDPIDVNPATLLVPNGLKTTAETLMKGTTTIMYDQAASASTQIPDINPHVGKWNIQVSPWLDHASVGNSATSWYLVAPPNIVPAAEIVYVDGKQVPYIESNEAPFDVLGMEWRAYYDFGVAFQDYRGAVKSTA